MVNTNGQRRRERTITYLTQDETKRLFRVMKDKRDRALFYVAYQHGLRASEVGLLHTADVDFKESKIKIPRVKGSLSGTYLIQPDAVKLLRSYLRSRKDSAPSLFVSKRLLPISRRRLDELIKHYGGEAKLPEEKQHFHILRHSIAVHLLDAGADVLFVKDRLGHKSIQNTMVYMRYTTTARDEQTRKLFASHRVV